MVLANLHKIDVFKKSNEKYVFWHHFGMPKPLKIDQTSCLKLMLFLSPTLFACFSDFGSIWGGPGRSKNCKKSSNNTFRPRLERAWTFGTISDVILNRF